MQKKLLVLFAFALFVLVVGWAVTPVQAHHCKGRHAFGGCVPGGGPGGDGGAGGKDTSLEITFDDALPDDNLLSDDLGTYIDKDGVGASTHHGNITLALGKGNHDRQVQLIVSCAKIVLSDINNVETTINKCDQLQLVSEDDLYPVEGQVAVSVFPYELNCPTSSLPDPECPDVFTMGTGPELMSLQVSFNDGLHIDVDDGIGGATAFDAGHCLSLLTEVERDAFLDAECGDPANCNVSITATNKDVDGKNDAWTIDAVGVTALICQRGLGDPFVIGQTTLTFGFTATKK